MKPRSRCECGKVKSAHDVFCKACWKLRLEREYDKAEATVATGRCPDCRTPLRRNLALTGWWQCGAYGQPSFRLPEHRDLPSCNFQTFTRR